MEEVLIRFEFKIGELVYIKGSPHHDSAVPNKHVILERLAQQCHGGIQRQYLLFGMGDAWVPEVALTRDEPPYKPNCDAFYQERERTQRQDRRVWEESFAKRNEMAEGAGDA